MMIDLVKFFHLLQDGKGGCTSKASTFHDYSTSSRLRLQNTRKLDCPAEIQIRCVKVFVDYGVDFEKGATVNSRTIAKRSILKQLEERICNQSKDASLCTMTRFYVKIPLSAIHLYHPPGEAATICQYVVKRILEKVFELVQKSITITLDK